MTSTKVAPSVVPAEDELTVSGLVAGTTYECVLSSSNGVGGYDAPLVPAAGYRSDEAVFDATYVVRSHGFRRHPPPSTPASLTHSLTGSA